MKMRKPWATFAVLAAFAFVLTTTACRNPAGTTPEPADIVLSVTEAHDFGSAQVGSAARTPLSVTVTNTGGLPTGVLTVALDGEDYDSFTVYPDTIPGIPAGGSATFTVGPNQGLAVDVYTATVMVSGGEGIRAQGFDVTFTVTLETPGQPGECGDYPCECEEAGQPGECGQYPCECEETGQPGECGQYPCECKEAGQPSYFVVTFYMHGGSPVGSQDVREGQSATRPYPAPTREGHTFVNWYTAATGGTVFDFAGPITANTTVHARWAIDTFRVTFAMDGGTPQVQPQDVDWNTTATRPGQDPTRPGHTFVNWFTAVTGGELFNFTTPITANTTIHARWEPANDFAISFEGLTDPLREQNIPALTLSLRTGYGSISITGLPGGADVRWLFQGDPIPGATAATLALNAIPHGDRIGLHSVTVEVLIGERLYSRGITFRVTP